MFGTLGLIFPGGSLGFTPDLLAFNRYRDQLDTWAASGITDKPTIYEAFMSGTYYAADKAVTPDFLTLLAALNGSVARASGGTLHDSAGKLVEFAPNTPRITDRAFRIEGGATNLIPNPRCEGAVVGSPGTLPTNMSGSATSNGISRQVVGSGTDNGIPYVDVRFSGTVASTGRSIIIQLAPASVIAAVFGDTFTISLYTAIVAGSIANLTYLRVEMYASSADGSQTENGGSANIVNGGSTRLTATPTIPSLAYIIPRLVISATAGTAVDFTLRFGAVQCEKSPYATSVILPPVGSPAQATRAADRVVSTRTSPTALSKLIRGRTAPWGGATQVMWQLDDGTNNNRLYVYRASNGNLAVYSVVGGSVSANLTIGAMADDTEFKLAFRAAANNFAVSLNGAAVITTTSGAIPTGLVNERLGHSINGQEWYGLVRDNHEFPTAMVDGDLIKLAA